MYRIRLTLIAALFFSAYWLAAKPMIAAASSDYQLTLLHTGNTFNRIQEFTPFKQPPRGGVARRAAVIKDLRAAHPNTLLLSSGTDVMGTPMFAQYGGVASADVMSLLGYDAALVSSLDVMAGGSIDAFKAYRTTASYPLLNSNLQLTNLPDVKVPSRVTLTKNGVKIGLFGLSNERSATLANFAGSISTLDTEKTIQDNLAAFQSDGVNIVIMLSSLGMDRDRELAAKYNGAHGIDVILGSDSGKILGAAADLAPNDKPEGPYPMLISEKSNPVALVYSGQFGTYLGELNLTFDEQGVLKTGEGRLHFLGESVKPEPSVQEHVDKLAAGIVMKKITLGETKADLFGSFQDYPYQENPLGNLYADAFLEYGKPFGAQIALVNSGSVWGTLSKGTITLADLYRIQPFFNWLIVMDVTGDQLHAILENGLSTFGGNTQGSGRFLHVAGMTYRFDPSQSVGQRVTEATFNGKPLDATATYTIVVNSFMSDGGDDYTMLKSAHNVFNTGISVTDVLQQYIQAHTPLDVPAIGRSNHVG